MLRIQNVHLNPGLDCGFDHDFLPGGMTVVLGRNQAGKTNLCRLIAGLSTQAVGELLLNNESLDKLSPQKRSVAVVFQAFVNYPNWSVAQNIASPMVAAGRDKVYTQSRVVELAEKLGLGELLQRMPNELSGGQQQRLAIARALAKEAQVLLLDEPLVNLDYKLREALALELRSLLDDSDTTVIYTTTDPKDAFTLGDDLLLLNGGSKLQAGARFLGPLSLTRHLLSKARLPVMYPNGGVLDPNIYFLLIRASSTRKNAWALTCKFLRWKPVAMKPLFTAYYRPQIIDR